MTKRIEWTDYATELVKRIPSNAYCAYLLNTSVAAVAFKRRKISGAIKARHYGIKKAKKLYLPIVKLIKKEFNVIPKKYNKKLPTLLPIRANSAFATLYYEQREITINAGDEIRIIDGKPYKLQSL